MKCMLWINHRLHAIQKLVDKCGLYTSHFQNVTADTTKQTDCALLQGKFEKLFGAKVFLWVTFSLDTLAEAKKFSLLTQKRDISITDVVKSAETTEQKYKRLLKKFCKKSEQCFRNITNIDIHHKYD